MIDETATLRDLRVHFLATSTQSMPLAGLIAWSLLGVAALRLSPDLVGTLALYIMAIILPLAFILDRIRGRNLFGGGNQNPLIRLFLTSIAGIAVMVPIAIIGARGAGDPVIVVLGMAILAGVIWIPYGWAAGDPVGLKHAIARALGCYAAYALAPPPYRASAICAVVVVAYVYSLIFMRRPDASVAAL